MSAPHSACFVLEGTPDREVVLRAVSALAQILNRTLSTRLIRGNVVERAGASEYQWIDTAAPPKARISFCDDVQIPARYVEVSTLEPLPREVVETELRKRLDVLSREELMAAAVGERQNDPGAITRLALGCRGDFDVEVARRVSEALFHARPEVRREAQMAVSLLSWKELDPVVAQAYDRESDPGLLPGLRHLLDRRREV